MVEIYSNIDGGFSNIKITGSIAKFFKLLPKVAEVVLIIPHTNAELERLVSIVKYMYMFMYIYIYIYIYIYLIYLERSSMKLDGILSKNNVS